MDDCRRSSSRESSGTAPLLLTPEVAEGRIGLRGSGLPLLLPFAAPIRERAEPYAPWAEVNGSCGDLLLGPASPLGLLPSESDVLSWPEDISPPAVPEEAISCLRASIWRHSSASELGLACGGVRDDVRDRGCCKGRAAAL